MSVEALEVLKTLSLQSLQNVRMDLIKAHEKQLCLIDELISRQNGSTTEQVETPQLRNCDEYPEVKPDQYKGIPAKPAIQLYLQERGGGPIAIPDLIRDLRIGGVISNKRNKVWQMVRYDQNVRITISQNPMLFVKDDIRDTVRMRKLS